MDEHDKDLEDLVKQRQPRHRVDPTDAMLLNLDTFYLEANRRGIVWTLYDLAVRDGLYDGDDEDFVPDAIPDFKAHGQAIEHVMQMEVAHFVFRHLNGPWGEVIDGMIGNRNRFCNEYREKTGYQIDTRQDDILS